MEHSRLVVMLLRKNTRIKNTRQVSKKVVFLSQPNSFSRQLLFNYFQLTVISLNLQAHAKQQYRDISTIERPKPVNDLSMEVVKPMQITLEQKLPVRQRAKLKIF